MLPKLLQRSRSWLTRRPRGHGIPDSQVKDRLVAEPWFVDRVSVSGSSVAVDGWSFPRSTPTEFFINDRRFDHIGYPLVRADVGAAFWQRRDAERSGFHCRSSSIDDPYPNGVMKISRSGEGDGIDSGRNCWYLPDVSAQSRLPDEDRRFRVMGNRDVAAFLYTGATDFHRLDDVVQKVERRAIGSFGSVLDWGVGCGRLARHFPAPDARSLTGCDIDHDNVAWCRANLAGHFVPSTMAPPLPFADDTFDLVYGVSVFTHLKEALQDAWLAELRRVTKAGGIVLVTVHGETAVEFFRKPPDEYARLKAAIAGAGLLVSSLNTQLSGFVEQPGEYVNVFHDRAYIMRRWSGFFDVLRVIPGYLFTHDLVVMRCRA
jgi:SAM-dependent methyltransferase